MKKRYRSAEQAVGMALITSGTTLLICISSLVAPRLNGFQRSAGVGFGLLVGFFSVWRLVRAGVYLYDNGVRILNPLKTHWVPWSEIGAFTFGRWGLAPKIALVLLRDGSVIPIVGIAAPNPLLRPRNQSVENLVAALNADLRTHRGETPAEERRASPFEHRD